MTGSRDIAPDTLTASLQDTIEPVLMAKLEFGSGDIVAHSGLGNLVFDGKSYLGVGKFGEVSAAEENSDLSRSPLRLTLSNIPGDMGAIALDESYQGRRATLYLGYIDQATGLLADDPVILYRGRMDNAVIRQGQTFTVTINIENRFAAWDKPKVRRYNNADQQSRHPGDKGCQYVELTTEKQIVWGAKL